MRGLAALVILAALTPATAHDRPPAPSPASGRTSGYHHLGATTIGEWSGTSARFTITDPEVRPGTYDFVAARLLAKRETADGVAWLEAGWAETGWGGDGRQRIYTYDSTSATWRFHDQIRLSPGDEVWIDLRVAENGAWQAWAWWQDAWHLLTERDLPIGPTGRMEQYVEIYHDDSDGPMHVPHAEVDYARVRAGDRDLPWTQETAPSTTGEGDAEYCVEWQARYTFWSAGSC
jgi:hypothetical protein